MTATILPESFVKKYQNAPTPFSNHGLGEFVYRRTYSRIKQDGTMEEWYETIQRVVEGISRIRHRHYLENNIEWNPEVEQEHAMKMYDLMFNVKFLPGGRSLWAMGTKITDEKNCFAALNNCAGVITDNDPQTFSKPFTFLFDMCMLGVGVGFDTSGAGKITINQPSEPATIFTVPDTREGWVEGLKHVLDSYFIPNSSKVELDYSAIRPAGVPLSTFGGTSSGPEPYRHSVNEIIKVLDNHVGQLITSRDIVDIMNLIALCVIAGNVRRSASIALGDLNDDVFINLKNYEANPERGAFGWLSNNSVEANIGDDYTKIGQLINDNGEPGVFWVNNARDWSRMNGVDMDRKDKDARVVNPCCFYHSLVQTDKGFIKIGEHVGETVNVWNGSKWTPALVRHTGDNQELFSVHFSDGSRLKCTGNHTFILADGSRKSLDELTNKDQLMRANYPIIQPTGGIDLVDAYDRGLYVGDGTDANKAGCKCTDIQLPQDFDKQFVPLYDYSVKTRLDYLAGYLDAVGNITSKQTKRTTRDIRLHSIDKDLLQKIKLLIHSLGCTCNFNRQYKDHQVCRPLRKGEMKSYHYKSCYEIYLNPLQIKNLVDLGLKCHRLDLSVLNYSVQDEVVQPLTMVYKKSKGIEPHVYCCTTLDDSHAFTVNGVLTGNCGEITLESYELCNLVEVFINRHDSYEDFANTLRYAFEYGKVVSLCGTQWKETTAVIQKNRRVGVSLTGIVNYIEDHGIENLRQWTTKGFAEIIKFDKEISQIFKINESIKHTTVKPSGTLSLLVPNTSPGVHFPTSRYYIRRVRVNNKAEKLIESMRSKGYNVVVSETEPNTMIIEFPIDNKCNRTTEDVSMWEQLELVSKLQEWWADNQVSATISFDKDREGKDIAHALDYFQYKLKGISFLPKFTGCFPQMPYEKITHEKYEELIALVDHQKKITVDEGEQVEESFCTSDTCFLKSSRFNHKRIIFMRGLPGSGKSYVARKLQEYFNAIGDKSATLSHDSFRYSTDGMYVYSPETEKKMIKEYNDELFRVVASIRTKYVILDNTHIDKKMITDTIKFLNDKEITDISYCVVDIPPYDDPVLHVKNNIHGISLERIEQQVQDYYASCPPTSENLTTVIHREEFTPEHLANAFANVVEMLQ